MHQALDSTALQTLICSHEQTSKPRVSGVHTTGGSLATPVYRCCSRPTAKVAATDVKKQNHNLNAEALTEPAPHPAPFQQAGNATQNSSLPKAGQRQVLLNMVYKPTQDGCKWTVPRA